MKTTLQSCDKVTRFKYMAMPKELSVTNAELIERMTSIGLDMAAVAKMFNISKRTLERRIAESPELKSHLMKGRLLQKVEIRQKLYDLAISGNCAALRFWITRFDRPDDNNEQEFEPEESESVYENAEDLAAAEKRRMEFQAVVDSILSDDLISSITTPAY